MYRGSPIHSPIHALTRPIHPIHVSGHPRCIGGLIHGYIQSEPPYIKLSSSLYIRVFGADTYPPPDTCIGCNGQVSRCIGRCIGSVSGHPSIPERYETPEIPRSIPLARHTPDTLVRCMYYPVHEWCGSGPIRRAARALSLVVDQSAGKCRRATLSRKTLPLSQRRKCQCAEPCGRSKAGQ